MSDNIVFCGPTLSHTEARDTLDALYLPPARQGDIVRAVLQHDPKVIVLIDGGFQSVPSVRHNEILWAISRGIVLIGAASLGALRAAELYPHMEGEGLIYRWYRRYMLAPDDAVAVLHGPDALGYMPLTDAGINLRMTFRAAHRAGAISSDCRRTLEAAAGCMNFRQRILGDIVDAALSECEEEQRQSCLASLKASYRNQKRFDALSVLDRVKQRKFRVPENGPFQVTQSFLDSLEAAGLFLTPKLGLTGQ